MPTSKLTMLIEAQTNPQGTLQGSRVGGWSESWYLPFGATAQVLQQFTPLCIARARLLAASARIIGQRIQQVDPTVGASQVASRVFPGQSGLVTDVPQMAVIVKIPSTGTPNIRQWLMRGLPDARVSSGEFDPAAKFTTDFTSFAAALEGYLFRGKNFLADQAEINYIDGTGQCFTNNPIVVTVGSLVDIMRTIDEEGNSVSGRFQVETVTSSTQFKLRRWDAIQTVGGKVRKHEMTFLNISVANITMGRVTLKKVGRPFTSYRGRRSKRR